MILKPEFSDLSLPLAEYPRPQFRRESYLPLNGEWDYAIKKSVEGETPPAEYDGKILVPYSPEAPASGVSRTVGAEDTLFYRRTVTLPEGFHRGRLLLQFGAVDQVARVFFNGEEAGRHEGGYTPFTVDVTPYVREGENEIAVLVRDNAASPIFGRGKQRYDRGGIFYTPQSGIWQSVFLESTPPLALTRVKLLPSAASHTLAVTPETTAPATVKVEAFDGERLLAAEEVEAGSTVTLALSDCELWSVENPQLYRLRLTVGEDVVESYFGLRTYGKKRINGKEYFTENEKPIFYNGLLDQGYWHEGLYTPPSMRALFAELEAVRAMGFNMLRKHCKVEPALYYYYCDILGIAVFQDMLNGGERERSYRLMLAPFFNLHLDDSRYERMGRGDPASRAQYRREGDEMQDALYNTVSLVLYTPFNEAWGQFDAVAETERFRARDGSRLYDHASGWQDKGGGDLYSRHIYFRPVRLQNDGKRILALTEFGGYSYAVEGHIFSKKRFGYRRYHSAAAFKEAYAALFYREIIPAIFSAGLSATVYTQLSDVEDEDNGLYTYDRVAKLPPDFVRTVNHAVADAFRLATNGNKECEV